MFSKPRIISTFASFVVIYFFPWIFYTYLAVDFFESQMITDVSRGDDMLLLPLTIGCLIMAYMFSSIYEKWGVGSYNIRNGIQYGVLIGLFFGAGIGHHVRNRNANHCNWTPSGCYILDRNLCGHWNGDQFRL